MSASGIAKERENLMAASVAVPRKPSVFVKQGHELDQPREKPPDVACWHLAVDSEPGKPLAPEMR
jgi:hypothetical protein